MATITAICEAIKARLDTGSANGISGLHGSAVVPASPSYPAAWPEVKAIAYDSTEDGDMTLTVEITVMVSAADLGRAQTNLLPYTDRTGTKSIKASLETFVAGQPWDSVRVQRMDGIGSYSIAGGEVIGAKFTAEIFA